MKKNFTNEQMIYTLRQAEAGTPVAEVCRKMGETFADLLSLEEEVWRHGRRRVGTFAATRR